MAGNNRKDLGWETDDVLTWCRKYPTPFYVYDEKILRERARSMHQSFSKYFPSYRNFFAVKATPNPSVISILKEEGMGVDCSSLPELLIAESLGYQKDEIFFSSNNTPYTELKKAIEMKYILNLDDISLLPHVEEKFISTKKNIAETGDNKSLDEDRHDQKKVKLNPKDDGDYDLEYLCFRFNPGNEHFGGNDLIGNPADAKFGLTRQQVYDAFEYIEKHHIKVKHLGIHTMVVSNSLDPKELLYTGELMFDLAFQIMTKYPSINLEFINLGGGIGIPYKPDQQPVDLEDLAKKLHDKYSSFLEKEPRFEKLKIFTECGRYVTAPAAKLITRCINQKKTYKNYIGVDACMANLMRPALYGSYHHITVIPEPLPPSSLPSNRNLFKSQTHDNEQLYDVVGSLCENNDKFAVDRKLGEVNIGDVLAIHDSGAHGHAMGFNYNGKLRCAEYLLKASGEVKLIRRAETCKDLFATLDHPHLNELREPRDK